MSEMSSMLCIPLYRDALSHHEPNWKRGLPLGTLLTEKPFPFQNRLVARGVMPVLDGSSACCSCRSCV